MIPPATSELELLLAEFRAALIRRDTSPYGSRAWVDADVELQLLQRQIFQLSFEEKFKSAWRARATMGDDDPADDGLGEREPPSVV